MPRDLAGREMVTGRRTRPRSLDVVEDGPNADSEAFPSIAGDPKLQLLLSRALGGIAIWLEQHAWLVVAAFALALYLPLSIYEAHSAPLTHDELFTVHIAQAPDLPSLLRLSREIDLHPPLHYLVQREALNLPIPRWFSARLPSIVAGVLTLLALFGFTARRLGALAGLVAVAVFWFGPLPELAWTNRPYMLWYALLALLLLAWSRATERTRSPLTLTAVATLALLLALTHLFGLACLLPFLLAEAVRARRLGRIDWPLALSLGAPLPLAALALFQLRHLGANGFPASNLPDLGLAARMYFHTVTDLFYVFGGCALALGLLRFGRSGTDRATRSRQTLPFRSRVPGLRREELVLLFALLALPLALMLAGSFAHIQFWARYGFFVVLPLAVLGARLAQRLLELHARVFAVLVTVALFLGAAARFFTDQPPAPFEHAAVQQPGVHPPALAQLDPALPIVAANPMTFVEMSDRESPAIAARTFYLTDRYAALRFSGYTLFDNEEKIRTLLQLPSHTAPLDGFLATHARFYLIASFTSPQEWLPRALLARGYPVHYLGKFVSTYDDDDLFLIDSTSPVAPASFNPNALPLH